MKILIVLLLLVATSSYAGVGVLRDATAVAIPTTFAGAGGTLLSNLKRTNKVVCRSDVAAELEFCWSASAAACDTKADAGNPDGWLKEAADTFSFDDDILGSALYVRAPGGVIATGNVFCRVWNRG